MPMEIAVNQHVMINTIEVEHEAAVLSKQLSSRSSCSIEAAVLSKQLSCFAL
jgi:hypothetical protein